MATTATLINLPAGSAYRNAVIYRWDLVNGESGDAIDLAAFPDRSVQVLGTFGVGGNARCEGSLLAAPASNSDYATLTDPQGNALDVTAAKIEAVSEATRWFRPRITAGDGTTALTIILLAIRK
jgi:hypothetical protein